LSTAIQVVKEHWNCLPHIGVRL